VYHYVFCGEVYILNDMGWVHERRITLRSSSCNDLALLQVSRQLHQETALLPYKLATFDLGVDEWIVGSSKDDAIVTFLELRSMAQIRALSRLEYHKYFRAWIKDDIEMGTGLYWAEYWDCKNFVSYINTDGGQIV